MLSYILSNFTPTQEEIQVFVERSDKHPGIVKMLYHISEPYLPLRNGIIKNISKEKLIILQSYSEPHTAILTPENKLIFSFE